jgi:hypothetical protein
MSEGFCGLRRLTLLLLPLAMMVTITQVEHPQSENLKLFFLMVGLEFELRASHL